MLVAVRRRGLAEVESAGAEAGNTVAFPVVRTAQDVMNRQKSKARKSRPDSCAQLFHDRLAKHRSRTKLSLENTVY